MDKAIHVCFDGLVQGVGFRFTARHLAHRYQIRGWVKNLIDGRVELIAEGSGDNLDAFMAELKNEFKTNVTNLKVETVVPTGQHKEFQIRF